MVEEAPASVDLSEFQFKLQSQLKVFDNDDDSKYKSATNLVAAASRFGLIFVASTNASLNVLQLKTIETCSSIKSDFTNFPRRIIPLPAHVSHVSLNCDQTLLAVTIIKDNCPISVIYNVPSFLSQNVMVIREIRLSATPSVSVLQSDWNPAMPSVFTASKSDGSLGIYSIQENSVDINEIPAMARATCFCWSPKGKQIVVGSMNGSLTQYKPDLKAVKAIPPPTISGMGSLSVLNVFWLTNYQFVAVYKDMNKEEAKPIILIVNAPKTGPTTYINYQDICYSFGTLRPPQYYIIHQPTWGVLLIASANSIEVAVLGISQAGEPALWQQWNQLDVARAELPLSTTNEETYPYGFTFDTGIQLQLPWGENQTLPPMPMIHILSHQGVLCSFNVINIRKDAPLLCNPPEQLADLSGLNQFVVEKAATAVTTPAAVVSPLRTTSTLQSETNSIGMATPVATTSPAGENSFMKPPTSEFTQLFGGNSQPLFGTPPSFGQQAAPLATVGNTSAPTLFLSSTAPNLSILANTFGSVSSTSTFGPVSSAPTFGTLAALGSVSSTPVVGSVGSAPNFGSVNSPSAFGSVSTASTFGSVSNAGLFGTASTAPTFVSTNTPFSFNNTSTFGSLASNSVSNYGLANTSVITTVSAQSTKLADTMASSSNVIAQPLAVMKPKTSNVATLNVTPNNIVPTVQASLQPKISTQSTSPSQNYGHLNLSVSKIPGQALLATPKEQPSMHLYQKPQQKPDILLSAKSSPRVDFNTTPKDDFALHESLIEKEVVEEVRNFELELNLLLQRCRSIKLNVGTEEEKNSLVMSTDDLLKFYNELQETTDSQRAEIQHLKQALLQSFAWYEESNARYKRYTDPHFEFILQSQDLDPVSEKQLADIKHLTYYIDSQLKQIDGFLDHQWADFQDSCRKQIKGKLRIPTLEPIYQTLVRQNAIIQKQQYLLKDIKARIKARNLKLGRYPHVLNVNVSDTERISLDEEFRRLRVDEANLYKTKLKKVASDHSNFTKNKESLLCSYFTNRSVVRIAPKKPKFVGSVSYTSTKIPSDTSFNSPRTAQRSLTEKFDSITQSNAQQSIDNPVEVNIAASSLFTFPLLPHQKKPHTPEKGASVQSVNQVVSAPNFNVPNVQQTSSFTAPPQSTAVINKPSLIAKTITTTAPVLHFSSPSFGTPQKPLLFNTPQTSPLSNFNLGSSISITAVTAPEKLNSHKSNTLFTFSPAPAISHQISDTKIIESPITTQVQTMFVKPAAKIITGTKITNSEIKVSQPLLFIAPQPKPNLVLKETTPVTTTSSAFKLSTETVPHTKENLDISSPFINFSTNVDPGKQSTPKSKSAVNFAQPQNTVSFTPTAGVVATSTVLGTQPTTMQPEATKSFFFIQPTVTTVQSQTSVVLSQPSLTVTIVPSTSASIATTSNTTSTNNSSSNVSVSIIPVATASPIASIVATASSPSVTTTLTGKSPIVSTTSPVTPPSLFGGKLFTPTTVSIFAQSLSTSTTNASTTSAGGNIFAIAVSSSATMFDGKTSTQAGVPIFGQKTTTIPAVTTTPFSFTVPNTSTAEPAKPATLFAVPNTTSSTNFGSPTTSTGFSFLQAANTVPPNTPKTTSVFTLPTTEKPPETTASSSDSTKKTQESSFGFDSLTVSSPDNKFSMGNLLTTALDTSGTAATVTTSATATTTSFSFELSSTNSTTTSSTSYSGFGNNIFGKATTTTTASSFIGQPICSPSFTQTTTSAFGQSSGNIFNQNPSSTNTTGGSIFGKPAGVSIFGGNANVTSTTTPSIFGQSTASIFGNASPNATTTSSIFGTSSTFGANTPTSTSSGIFGQNAFGTPAATSTSSSFSFATSGSVFGEKPTFGQTTNFGQVPPFGSPSAFGPIPATGPLFGPPSSPTQNTNAFGGFESPTAFGQKPSFGSPPSFGQSTFGAPATFGAQPTFGSPQRVFGSTASPSSGTFGSNVQENSTFANLANQTTLGFGSLAQNQGATPPAEPPQFSGGAQFSSWR